LTNISQTLHSTCGSHDEGSWRGVGGGLGVTGRSLTGLLRDSTVGVAFFDRGLHCRALNGALCRMIGVSGKRHIGKTMHQVFRGEAPKLAPAFQRVWGTGNSLSNVKMKAQLTPSREVHHWLVNFYPVKDELGQVRLVAAAFSEVTKRRCAESQLRRIRDKCRTDAPGEPTLFGEEFSEMSAQTVELVKRSVALLEISMSLRSYVSEMRLETGLERLALFLTVSHSQEAALEPALQHTESGVTPCALPESPEESKQSVGGPSFRERQVLRYLADGKSNKEIGVVLDISTRTVESYRARIMIKLDLHSTAALVRYAIRHKIIEA
jgi:DNA-binding CsgD family transcriptional regulator